MVYETIMMVILMIVRLLMVHSDGSQRWPKVISLAGQRSAHVQERRVRNVLCLHIAETPTSSEPFVTHSKAPCPPVMMVGCGSAAPHLFQALSLEKATI